MKKLYMIEGIPGSGKTTFARKLAEGLQNKYGVKNVHLFTEGDLHQADMAWCALLTKEEYDNRVSEEIFCAVLEDRWTKFGQEADGINIFECALLQNAVNELCLFHQSSEEKIRAYVQKLLNAVQRLSPEIIYLDVESVEAIGRAAAERIDEQGNRVWEERVAEYVCNAPFGQQQKYQGTQGMLQYFTWRQQLEKHMLPELSAASTILPVDIQRQEEQVQTAVQEIMERQQAAYLAQAGKPRRKTQCPYIAPGAYVGGNVTTSEDVGIWYNAVIRGDSGPINIGKGTNIQDNSTVHTDPGHQVQIGSHVTVGHNAIIHGCTIGDGTLIGMGSILLNDAVIGKNCIIGAGALVTGGTDIPDGSLAYGNPAKVVRALRTEEIAENQKNADHYVELMKEARKKQWATEFWNDFLRKAGKDPKTEYLDCFHFELTEEWANKLLELVLNGQKRATASSLICYEIDEERMPQVGDYSIVTDWDGVPHCVIETTAVTIIPFKNVTYDICKREGEDENLESWQTGHRHFFTSEAKEAGYVFTEDMPVIFEDFEVVYRD